MKQEKKAIEGEIKDKNQSIPVKINKFKDLEGKFLLVRVGTSEIPASKSQIEDIQKELISLFEKNNVNCLVFVTHHAVEMKIIEKEN